MYQGGVILKKYADLTEKEKQIWKEFLFSSLNFTLDELRGLDEQQLMTQELFNSCMNKCIIFNLEKIMEILIEKYPDFTKYYLKNPESVL